MAYKSLISYIFSINAAVRNPTETAPATDTASSGLNGRAQRIAQRITSLIAEVTTLKNDTALVKADIASLKTIETDSQAHLLTIKNDTALVKADIASLKTIETDSQAHLLTLKNDTALVKADTALVKADIATIKNTLAGTVANTYNNIIVAKTGAETTADIQLTKTAYALTALGLAGAETVTLQVKDTVTNAYFTYLTLTAAAPVANIGNLPVTARIDKSVTVASVGVMLNSH